MLKIIDILPTVDRIINFFFSFEKRYFVPITTNKAKTVKYSRMKVTPWNEIAQEKKLRVKYFHKLCIHIKLNNFWISMFEISICLCSYEFNSKTYGLLQKDKEL